MATEQIQAQAAVVTPATNDKLLVQQAIDGITRYMTPQQILDLIATIGQAEAEAGNATTRRMWTAERVKQAIAALAPVTFKIPVLAKTATYTLTTSDIRKLIDATGTWTLTLPPAGTAGDGFWFAVRNSGTGIITLDPDTAELIDGSATLTLGPGQSGLVIGNAAAWKTVGLSGAAVLDRVVAPVTTANTVAETAVYTKQIDANTLGSTRALRLTFFLDMTNNTGSDRTFTIRLKFGATTVTTTGVLTLPTSANPYIGIFVLTLYAANATGAQKARLKFDVVDPVAVEGNPNGPPRYDFIARHNTIAEDSTQNKNLVVTVEMSTASANCSNVLQRALLELA